METLAGLQGAKGAILVVSGPELRPRTLAKTPRWEEVEIRGNSDVRATRGVLRLLRSFNPDAVVLHACAPGELVVLGALSSLRRATVLLEHAPEYQPLGNRLRNQIYASLARRLDRWAAVSTAGARALESRWRLPAATIRTVHLGVGEPAAGLSDEEAEMAVGEGPLLLALGAPKEIKGISLFREVAERVERSGVQARWLWIGGSEKETVGPVQILPWSSHVGGWLRAADLLLIPSRAEGLPLVLLEAFACGTPVAASRVGGIPEALDHSVQGVLLPPEDADAWSGALGELLGNEERRRQMGSAARRRWEERFTAEAMAERIEALLREAIESRERPRPA